MGCIYRPKKSPYWWIKYYASGKAQYESTRTQSKEEARRILKSKEGRIAGGESLLPRVDRILYEEASQDLRVHYQVTGRRNMQEAGLRLRHLDRHFSGRRLATIGYAEMTAYVRQRQEAGVSNGTINRELSVLHRMLRLAYKNGKLLRLPPSFDKPKENPARQGFFERSQYEAVVKHLRPDLQLATAIEYALGWRCQSEVLTLELRQIDLEAGTIRLDPGKTKNDAARDVDLPPPLKLLIAAQVERIRALERQTGRIIPHLFPHTTSGLRYRAGDRIKDFKKAWVTACKRAGVSGMLRHDFRRTAVRNMINAGVPDRVAMDITGHKTRSVFDRYHIVSPGDRRAAAAKIGALLDGIVKPTVIPLDVARNAAR